MQLLSPGMPFSPELAHILCSVSSDALQPVLARVEATWRETPLETAVSLFVQLTRRLSINRELEAASAAISSRRVWSPETAAVVAGVVIQHAQAQIPSIACDIAADSPFFLTERLAAVLSALSPVALSTIASDVNSRISDSCRGIFEAFIRRITCLQAEAALVSAAESAVWSQRTAVRVAEIIIGGL